MANISKIKKLTDREHILHRPSMYIGGISNEEVEDFAWNAETANMQVTTLSYPPGLVKIINEVIDNSVDAILKTGKGDKIEVWFDGDVIHVKDNSTGFPAKAEGDEVEPVVLALGNARAGSNFEDENNIGQMGTNGVGAFATNCFSKSFVAETFTNGKRIKAEWSNNATDLNVSYATTKGEGTLVYFLPDLERFGVTSGIPEDVKLAIETRLRLLAFTYKHITFEYQSKKIKIPKQLTEWFEVGEDPYIRHQGENYEVYVIARAHSTRNFSFVNGLNIKDGGTHLDVITADIAKGFGNTRISANKADITNTLQVIFTGIKFKNLRFNSQTKEKITNSAAETRAYLGDLSPLVNKVVKSKDIKDFIKATTAAREMRANKAKLGAAKKAKIKSEKFLDAQQERTNLMLVEGDSALGGLLPSLGRKNIAYYALKGKPLNAWSATTQKLTANKELSELLSIVHQSDFERIIFGTDQDLDGFHIRGLLLGFIWKYLPEYADKVYFLQTPVRGVTRKGELVRWSFDLKEDLKIKPSEQMQYYKGLGTWDREDLKHVLDTEGFENLLTKVELDMQNPDHLQILEAWLGADSQSRKDFILANDFNIAKI